MEVHLPHGHDKSLVHGELAAVWTIGPSAPNHTSVGGVGRVAGGVALLSLRATNRAAQLVSVTRINVVSGVSRTSVGDVPGDVFVNIFHFVNSNIFNIYLAVSLCEGRHASPLAAKKMCVVINDLDRRYSSRVDRV